MHSSFEGSIATSNNIRTGLVNQDIRLDAQADELSSIGETFVQGVLFLMHEREQAVNPSICRLKVMRRCRLFSAKPFFWRKMERSKTVLSIVRSTADSAPSCREQR